MRTILMLTFLTLFLSLNVSANPYYETFQCIDEDEEDLGPSDIAQCVNDNPNNLSTFLCPIDSVRCNDINNEEVAPPLCSDGKVFDREKGVCSETLVNNAECPAGASLSDDRCSGLLTDIAKCPVGQSLSDGKCSQTLHQTAGCPSGQSLNNDVCSATITDAPKCPSGQTYNSATGRCNDTIYSNAQCPSGSSLSNDRCNGLLVEAAKCPSGQTLKNGVCTVTLTKPAQCSAGQTLINGKCQLEKVTDLICPTGYSMKDGSCVASQTYSPKIYCEVGELNGGTCESTQQECRYDDGNRYISNVGQTCNPFTREVQEINNHVPLWDGSNLAYSGGSYTIGKRMSVKEVYNRCTADNITVSYTQKSFEICKVNTVETPPSQTCNPKDSFNDKTGQCVHIDIVSGTCPSGYDKEGTKCTKTEFYPPLCQSGYGYNFSTNRCEKTTNSSPICKTGYSFNITNNRCEKSINTSPICATGYTYNPAVNKCQKTVTSTPFCQTGYEYNNNQKTCTKVVISSPICNAGYGYNFATDRCEKNVSSNPICKTGYNYNLSTNKCEKTLNLDPICPAEYSYNPKNDRCEKILNEQASCPVDYDYDEITKQCQKHWITHACPYGEQYQCVMRMGAPRCSPNSCFDPNTEKVEEDDDIDGTMLINNGDVNEEGLCLDQVYIFNGRAQKCRTKGVQTAFKDCCESDGKVLKDGGGSSAQSQMTSASIQAIYQASAAAYNAYSAGATMAEAGNAFTSGFVGAFDPTSLAVSIAIAIVMDYLAKACDQIETETALANSSSMCVYVGEYCKEKWLGRCVQKAKSYCCFNSQLAKIINEQGRSQLKSFENVGNRGFGEVKSPQCRGFTPEEFQALDFSNIDLSDYYEEITHRAQSEVQETMESMTEEYFNNVN